jgi:hypothetical protein
MIKNWYNVLYTAAKTIKMECNNLTAIIFFMIYNSVNLYVSLEICKIVREVEIIKPHFATRQNSSELFFFNFLHCDCKIGKSCCCVC